MICVLHILIIQITLLEASVMRSFFWLLNMYLPWCWNKRLGMSKKSREQSTYHQHFSLFFSKNWKICCICNTCRSFLLPHVRESRFWNPGNFCLWNPESRVFGIRNPTNDWNPESKVLLKNTGIQYLESGIHSMESRIQECLGFPYMGRFLIRP